MAANNTVLPGGRPVGGTFRSLYETCKEVSEICDPKFTVQGYAPNFGANVFFAAMFFILATVSAVVGIWKRTWTFAAAVSMACFLEGIGYIGRVVMSSNAWDNLWFQIQICMIIIAPTILTAAIYLILKHLALTLSPSLSRVRPRWYPLFFLPADISCLVIQAIGGSLAAASTTNKARRDGGNKAIVAGIALQVCVLLLFGGVAGEYLQRVRKAVRKGEVEPRVVEVWRSRRFKSFLRAVGGAYLAVQFRCIYRVAEMAGGWGNKIMQDEISFMVLDSGMVLIASTLLTCFPPGIFLPQMAGPRRRAEREKPAESTGSPTTTEA